MNDIGCDNIEDNVEANCGDNAINQISEVCDGVALKSKTCVDFGYINPVGLACNLDCTDYDAFGCSGETVECSDGIDNDNDGFIDMDDSGCGNPSIDQEANCGDNTINQISEICDGSELVGKTCVDFGFTLPGGLACSPSCLSFDISHCLRECSDGIDNDNDGFIDMNDIGCDNIEDNVEANCGDGVKNGDEACDGIDLGDKVCGSLGPAFVDGILDCYPSGQTNECEFDISQCISNCAEEAVVNVNGTCTIEIPVGVEDVTFSRTQPISVSWDEVRDSSASLYDNALHVYDVSSRYATESSGWEDHRITRSLLPFDTSVISSDAQIVSAKLDLTTFSVYLLAPSNYPHDFITIVNVNMEAPPVVQTTDFGHFNQEVINEFDRFDIQENFRNNGTTFTFSLDDLSVINGGGWTTLGLMSGPDFTGDVVGFGDLIGTRVTFYSSAPNDNIDEAFRPKLEVTYFIPTICGDGIIDEGEQCDDGNNNNFDNCRNNCVFPFCGDSILDQGEQCDDGNTRSRDGCSADCKDERVASVCGNNIVEKGEECDDGNLRSGDGCSNRCDLE